MSGARRSVLALVAALAGCPAPAGAATVPADIDAFQDAIVAGDLGRLDRMLAALAAEGRPLPATAEGTSLLHKACHWYSPEPAAVVSRLLAAGADVHARTRDGRTPLHFAAQFHCAPCARVLLGAGADPAARDEDGATPLHGASREVVPVLLAAGADPAARDVEGNVPLHRSFDAALLAPGVGVRNHAGLTPLHFAALAGSVAGIEWLLAEGADPAARTTKTYWYRASFMSKELGPGTEVPAGATALDLARREERATRWSSGKYLPVVAALERARRRPPGIEDFLARFRAALAGDDAAAVAALTRLPFLYDGRPRDRAGFIRVYPALFTPEVRACLARTAPRREGDRWVAFCGPYAFYFGRDGAAFRLLEFGADGEEAPSS